MGPGPHPCPSPARPWGGRRWKGTNLCVGGGCHPGKGSGPPSCFLSLQALPKAKRALFSGGMGPLPGSCFSQSLSASHHLAPGTGHGLGLRMPVTVLNVSHLTLQPLLVMFPTAPSPPISFGPYWFKVMWSTWGAGGRVGLFSTRPLLPLLTLRHLPCLVSPLCQFGHLKLPVAATFFFPLKLGQKSSRPGPPSILSGGPGCAHSNDTPAFLPGGLEPTLLHCYTPKALGSYLFTDLTESQRSWGLVLHSSTPQPLSQLPGDLLRRVTQPSQAELQQLPPPGSRPSVGSTSTAILGCHPAPLPLSPS